MKETDTKLKDSFGNKYYDWCHAYGERYVEEGVYNKECSEQSPYGEFVYDKLPDGFRERGSIN